MNIDRYLLVGIFLCWIIVDIIYPGYLASSGFGQEKVEKVKLVFSIHQEQDIYDQSTYGEPPQFAIWLQDPESREYKTVFVTFRTGTGEFEGKIECPVSLPIWIGVYRSETGNDDFPRPWEPFYDGVTGATPKSEDFEVSVCIEKSKRWLYFIEINVAGDYNKNFPYISSKKKIDNHGNGQPSLIYKGQIVAETGNESSPKLIGRSEQYSFSSTINQDLDGIELAKEVFSRIIVICK
jgi:hypothetical protein